MLEAVAVAGGTLRSAAAITYPAATGVDERGIALRELLDADLATEVANPTGTIVHASVPSIVSCVAADVDPARARAIHSAIESALRALSGVDPRERSRHIRVIADALPPSYSVPVLVDAAERAATFHDYTEAALDLECAAAVLDSVDPAAQDLIGALIRLGDVRHYLGDSEGSEQAFRRAQSLLDQDDPRRSRVVAKRRLLRSDQGDSAVSAGGLPTDVIDIESARATDDPDGTAEMGMIRLTVADRAADPRLARDAARALSQLEVPGAPDRMRAAAAVGRSILASLDGDPASALEQAERAYDLATAGGSPMIWGAAVRQLLNLFVLSGDLPRARELAEKMADRSYDEGPLLFAAADHSIIAAIALLGGDVAGASAEAELGLKMGRRSAAPRVMIRVNSVLGLILAMRGDLDRARSLLAESEQIWGASAPDARLAATMDCVRLELALAAGDPVPPAVGLCLDRADAVARLVVPTLLGRLVLARREPGALQPCLDVLDAVAGSPVAAALAMRLRGLALASTPRRAEAAELLGECTAALGSAGLPLLAAEAQLEWAELAVEGGDASPRELLPALVQSFDEWDRHDWADRARRLARTVGVRVGGRRGGPGELTRRESEVVALVAQGCSNAEVAAKLFLSERTVEAHLRNVYQRLGVDSRFSLLRRLGAADATGTGPSPSGP